MRLRYTASDIIAPYIGVRHVMLLGPTATAARAAAESRNITQWMIGLSVGWNIKPD